MAKTSTPPRQGRRPASSRTASPPWSLRRSGGLCILELAPFKRLPWLVHGFSTRTGGVSTLDGHRALNLSFMGWDRRENVLQNRRRFQSAVHAIEFRLL
ncbi:MAG TPA: hypothetical protein VKB90_00325, partial [Candidatus Acidoferrum sp.]|nr:hypothetical protein [Candidatus Acidoferrum sp.]